MSKAISRLLDQPEHLVSKLLTKLEDKNGYPSHDARHLAENIQSVRRKIGELNLDPNDTTAEELYQALLSKFETDSRSFEARYHLDSNSFEARADQAVRLVSSNIQMPQRWALKSPAAKNLLRRQVPRRLMKQLGYRSLDSLLKRENLCEIYSALSFIESAAWHKELNRLVSKLDSTAFELRPLSLIYLPRAKWGDSVQDQAVIYSDHTGNLALSETDAPLLSMSVLLINSLSNFNDLNLSDEVSRLSPDLAWWSDMDGLICSLNDEQVSLNIKDLSHKHSFTERSLDNSRRSFWQQLLARYDNQLEIQEDLALDLKDYLINLSTPINQPAFEYVEDM